jgi:two-component system, OmpR family, response regulator
MRSAPVPQGTPTAVRRPVETGPVLPKHEDAMPTILVADDEAHIRDVVQYTLEREGHRVLTAADGAQALARAREGGIDLVILDVLMPELDGLAVCRRLREERAIPIIFLSSRAEEVDRVLGLELGGDDYVVKPFSPRELAARVKTVLRRATPPVPAFGRVIARGRLVVDTGAHEVRVDGTLVDLTVTEFGVLRMLLEYAGRVLSRADLIEQVRDADYHVTERAIDTHVRRIRAKLRPFGLDPIETVHGVGYKAAPAAGT